MVNLSTNKSAPPRSLRSLWHKTRKWLYSIGVVGVLGLLASITGLWDHFFPNNSPVIVNSSSKQVDVKSSSQIVTTVTGDNNTVVTENTGRVEGVSTSFSTDFNKSADWIFTDGLHTDDNIISYAGYGQTELHLTKNKFSQTNTYTVTIVPLSQHPDLVLRVENSFDIRFGDGGSREVALYKFARAGNWPPVKLQNQYPKYERETRWILPCSLVVGNVVTIIINVTATGEFRKNVTLQYDYQCQSGKHVDPQNEDFTPALWSFPVYQSTNVPASFGVGINDPKGKDNAKVEIKSIDIQNS